MLEKSKEFSRYCQKLMEAPEPPSAMASEAVWRPKTRLNAPRLKSAGRRLAEFAASDPLVERAVRRTQ
jgi:hypothetical protein